MRVEASVPQVKLLPDLPLEPPSGALRQPEGPLRLGDRVSPPPQVVCCVDQPSDCLFRPGQALARLAPAEVGLDLYADPEEEALCHVDLAYHPGIP